MMRSRLTLAVLMGMFLMAGATSLLAQPAPPPGGQPPQNGERRRPDPAEMRQRFMDRIKEQLGASDDEWKVLSPKVEQLLTARSEMRGSGMSSMFSRGGRPDDRQPETATGKASAELRKVLDNKDARPNEIVERLAALRAAREKAKADYANVQKELKELLTPRQEATLVMYGLLE